MQIFSENFINSVIENYPVSKDKIIDAYKFASKAHEGIKRKSGEPYIVHPVAVAQILIDNNMDYPTIIAGLLHDVVEDTKITSEEIKEKYGETVAKLVEGVTKIDKITAEANNLTESDSLKKLLLAMAEDIRIIFIKLADRLHNMRTIEFLGREKQLAIAKETQELFIPIAERIGVRKLRAEMQALTFKCAHPEEYEKIKAELDAKLKAKEKDLMLLENEIKIVLSHGGVSAKIVGFEQNYYSTYKKIQGKGIDKIYGLRSFKIIVPTEIDCYKVLGLLHKAYTPIPSQIKDYIALPKINGYQSLNSALISKGTDITFNVMIRTEKMDKNCEFGVSSLWQNKDNDKKYEDKFEKHNDLKKIIMGEEESVSTSDEFVRAIKSDLVSDMTWVFTPQHKPIRINAKAPTAIDFAYNLHSEIGKNAIAAVINKKEMPLKTELKNGDEVEIIISKKDKAPSRDWLIYARTPYARKKIREYFKKNITDKNIDLGKKKLEVALKKAGHTLSEVALNYAELQREFYFTSIDDIYSSASRDQETINKIIEFICKKEFKITEVKKSPILVENENILSIDIAGCCGAVDGDEIVGVISKNGVTVHCKDCQNLKQIPKYNYINVKWKPNLKMLFETGLKIFCTDGIGILAKVFVVFAKCKIDISKIVAKRLNSTEAEINLMFKVYNHSELDNLIKKLDNLNIVKSVKRIIN